MIHLVLKLHPVVDDVRGHQKRHAGNERAEHGLPGGDGHPAVCDEVGEPADQQLEKGDGDGREQLEQPVPEKAAGVLLRENLPPVYVGEDTA